MWLNEGNDYLLNEKREIKSFRKATGEKEPVTVMRGLAGLLLVTAIVMALPWTQTTQATGFITTREPERRPQDIQAIIAGRIDSWYVKEGDTVQKGDTLIKLTEIKENYLDPSLLQRTEEQIKAKENNVDFYRDKVTAVQNQIQALYETRELKLEQIKNKIQQATLNIETDSMGFVASEAELRIAEEQFKRQEELYKQGLKSLTELEQRKQQLQNAKAKYTMASNKFSNTKNELLNAKIELNSVDRDYTEKISKAESDKFATLSDVAGGEAELAKLRNQFSNYAIRNAFYYVLAPQSGQITRTISAGIGEVVKEGDVMVRVVPNNFQYAVELYIPPTDLPLVSVGQDVRVQFDGWPAIVFSGWPGVSYGTFGGKIAAVDNSLSENGKLRILVVEDTKEKPWPRALKAGGGAKGMALLNNVPVIYELWRKMNGFPPDFYTGPSASNNAKNEAKK